MANIIEKASSIASRSGIVSSAGTLLAPNPTRRNLVIQNLGTNPLYVCFGAGASTTVFDVILKGSAVAADGTGGTFTESVLSYQGQITVAGTAVSCTATEF